MSTITQPRRSVQAKSRPLTVTLTMEINGVAYHVEPIGHAPGGTRSYRLAKVGGDAAVYDVDAFADRVECSCPSYAKTHHGTTSLCKHGRALVMVGLVDYPDSATPADDARSAYDTAREKLAAIAESEARVRSEASTPSPKAPAFDEQLYICQNAVAERRALWLRHRHLHTSDPLPSRMTIATNDGHSEPRLVDDDGTPLETSGEMAERPREEHAAKVAEVLAGGSAQLGRNDLPLPACCPDDEPAPCRACVTFEGPGDASDDGWDDSHVWTPTDFTTDDDDEPFAAWLDDQAEHFAAIGSPRAKWLALKIGKLAEQARFLDAASPDAFDDRLDCLLDAEAARIEARHSSARC